jgi:hypothetical protein
MTLGLEIVPGGPVPRPAPTPTSTTAGGRVGAEFGTLTAVGDPATTGAIATKQMGE